jgi:predicted GNAT family N-acyltransferase
VELVELGALTEADWADLLAGEQDAFGPIGAGLAWRPKDRHVALRADDGRLVAAAGVVVAAVEVARVERFDVVGVGSLIVTRALRGQGLMSSLFGPLWELVRSAGPERAMLFCRRELVAFYHRRLAFAEIAAPVWADQPQGRVRMPLAAMWRAVHDGVRWPAGRVDVRGLPF